MKKYITFIVLVFTFVASGLSQKPAGVVSTIEFKKKATSIITEASKNVEISAYQQKQSIAIIQKVMQEHQSIVNSRRSEGEKTKAFEALKSKQEYALRGVLNDTQYDMVSAFMKDQ